MPETDESPKTAALSRRKLFAYTGAVGASGLAMGAGAATALTAGNGSAASAAGMVPAADAGNERLDFYGVHQPGMDVPAQSGLLGRFRSEDRHHTRAGQNPAPAMD
jgi:hypothetical protein